VAFGSLPLFEKVEELFPRGIVGGWFHLQFLPLGYALSLLYPFRPHEGGGGTVLDADATVLAHLLVERDIKIHDNLRTKSPICHAVNILTSDLGAGPDALPAEDAAGHVPEYVPALFRSMQARLLYMEFGRAYFEI
jgi:hypothetical protein